MPVVVVGLLQALAKQDQARPKEKKAFEASKGQLYRALLECTVDCAAAAAAVACVGWYVVSGSQICSRRSS